MDNPLTLQFEERNPIKPITTKAAKKILRRLSIQDLSYYSSRRPLSKST